MTLPDALHHVQSMLDRLGMVKMTRISDAPPAWSLRFGERDIGLVAGPEYVVATCEVAPGRAGDTLPRRLLEAQPTMNGAFFTLERDGGVRVNHIVPRGWLADSELAFVIGNVALCADAWERGAAT